MCLRIDLKLYSLFDCTSCISVLYYKCKFFASFNFMWGANMKYKKSQYNFVLPLRQEEGVYIFNTKSGAIVKLNDEVYRAMESGDFESAVISPYISNLVEEGIIVSKGKNEYNEIIFLQKSEQFKCDNDRLSIVIAPTLACNYKCVYCFESGITQDTSIMDQETFEDIFTYIEQYLKRHRFIKTIHVQWFGGEPLLSYQKVIVPLSNRFLEFCKSKNIIYESGIVTNGYLLTHDVSETLVRELNVSEFQITFDGTKDNYEKYKKPPQNAYNRVLENMFYLSEYAAKNNYKIRLNIRINVHKENCNNAIELYQDITKDIRYNKNISLYLGYVKNTKACACLALHEFEQVNKEFSKNANKPIRKFEPKKIWCQQFTVNNFCIGPRGEIYACEHDFGREERIIGHVSEGLFYNDYYKDYMNQSVATQCINCILFPLCLGGCPNQRYNSANGYSCEMTRERIIAQACEYVESQKSELREKQ